MTSADLQASDGWLLSAASALLALCRRGFGDSVEENHSWRKQQHPGSSGVLLRRRSCSAGPKTQQGAETQNPEESSSSCV